MNLQAHAREVLLDHQREDFSAFARLWSEVTQARLCTNPVRLVGTLDLVDVATGELREVYSTDREPAGVLLKPCGTRRAALCPACAEVYRRDAYQLIMAGLRGGKGVPEQVTRHPAVFVTFTAPSFGPVHARVLDRAGRARPCHPRRHTGRCPHGRPADCRLRHRADDPRLGEPLCGRCYDYEAQVLWNALAPELWHRTVEYIRRALAHHAGIPLAELRRTVRVEFAKVAEYQARGVVHFHAVIRLDAHLSESGVTASAEPFGVAQLEVAIRHAARMVAAPVPGAGLLARWGDQLDLRRIADAGVSGGQLTAARVAGYIAKYATKATETFGTGLEYRLRQGDVDRLAARGLRLHVVRLVRAAWELGGTPEFARLRLRKWAHMLGFGGHWTTRSRRYSTTFRALRAARHAFARDHGQDVVALGSDGAPAAVSVVLASWTYQGRGYRTEDGRALALAIAARTREHLSSDAV